MMNKVLLFLISIALFGCSRTKPQTNEAKVSIAQKEALLIGTFHYNNPGADVAKTKSFDILSKDSQNELENIAQRIKTYNPTKIFVEWPYDEQSELDSLYHLYRKNQYFSMDSLSDFYVKNEIFQLAFRAAHANNMENIYGIDYATSFPFKEVMKAIEEANQTELMSKIQDGIAKFTVEFDTKIEEGASLVELTSYLNTPKMRKFSNHFHNNLMLLAGDTDDFSGPLLTSEWYKRNLYMWSLVQKNTMHGDERIMILVGASHAAMFELFIKENEDWKVKEFLEIMEEIP